MNQTIENRLKKISIRGRMALGIKCLENFLDKNELIHKKEIKKLVQHLWEFTNSKSLDSWEEKILEFNPESLIENFENKNYADFKVLTSDEVNEIYSVYKQSEGDLLALILGVIEIGRGNLYGGTGEYSKWTLAPTIEVLNILERNNCQIPELVKFEKSKFSELQGWGMEREKSFFE